MWLLKIYCSPMTVVFFVISLCACCTLIESLDGDGPVVKTEIGSVRGRWTPNAQEYLGVPFAQPPVGSLRWSKPRPATSWAPAVLDASARKPACPQKYCATFLPNNSCPNVTSEDCLYLDIWTPLDADSNTSYPVMVFLHGGAFKWGSASLPVYDGNHLARDGHVIVVCVEYRIGLLGYLYTGDGPGEATGNYGVQDQRLALQWVQHNIAAFGGDPAKVTLFGQSAGAQSTFIHLVSSLSSGLFRAAIVESSPFAVPYRTKDEARVLSDRVRELLKCRERDFDCLLNKTVDEVNDAQQRVSFEITGGKFNLYFEPIGPIIDGTDITVQPLTAARLGKFRDIPTMLGTVSEEGRLFVYGSWKHVLNKDEYEAAIALLHPKHFLEVEERYPAVAQRDHRDQLSQLTADFLFTCATRNVSRNLRHHGNASRFLYVFDHASSGRGEWGKDTFCEGHVCHAEELGFLFENHVVSRNTTKDEVVLSDQLVTFWSNFAYSMNPNIGPRPSQLIWPNYAPDTKSIMHFQTPQSDVLPGYRDDLCDFWDTNGYEEP